MPSTVSSLGPEPSTSASSATPARRAPGDRLPRRWTRWQRIKNTAIYGGVRGFHAAARLFPLERAGFVAAAIGRIGWWASPRPRRIALENLAAAFPELDEGERERIARGAFRHLARTALELIRIEALERGPRRLVLSDEHRALLAEASAHGRGVVLVSGHTGNWELIPPLIAGAGFPIAVIGRKLYDPRFTRWVHAFRSRHGVEVLWRGNANLMRSLLAVFRRGEMFGSLIDQDTDVQGAFVPFFGRPAHTPTAAASLALRQRSPTFVCWSWRDDGGVHRLHLEPVEHPTEGTAEERTTELTARFTRRLEDAIRAHPEQWVWMHRRWRK